MTKPPRPKKRAQEWVINDADGDQHGPIFINRAGAEKVALFISRFLPVKVIRRLPARKVRK